MRCLLTCFVLEIAFTRLLADILRNAVLNMINIVRKHLLKAEFYTIKFG